MTDEAKPKRRYNAARRRAQAEETRRAIIEAARALFIERGYAGTTMDKIAQRAGVAVETVYATFHTKRAVLARVMEVAAVGDHAPVAVLDREGPRLVRETSDQQEQIRLFSREIREIMGRVGPVFEVMRGAAPTEPEIAALLEEYLERRRTGMAHFVQALLQNGPLRPGLTPDEATDAVWTMTSAEVYGLLTRGRSWPGERYETWLAETLAALLLPMQPGGRHRGLLGQSNRDPSE